jgi:hypothetical protein
MKMLHPLLLAVLVTVSAHAGPSDTKDIVPVTAPSASPAGVVFTGISDRASSWYSYAGTVYSLNQNLDASGWLLRADLGGGQYSYVTSGFQGRIRGSIFDSSAGIGYKYAEKNWNVSGVVGPNFRDKILNVTIPTDSSISRVGAKLNLDLYAKTDSIVWSAIGQYSTIDNSTWDRARVGYQFDVMKLTVGPEFSYCRGDDGPSSGYDEYRTGGFVSWRLNHFINISLSSGYANYKGFSGGNSSSSVYGELGLSFDY